MRERDTVAMGTDTELIRHWIERLLTDHHVTASAAARRAGVAPTTLTRFLSRQVDHVPSSRTLIKLSRAFNAPPPAFVSADGVDAVAPDLRAPELRPFRPRQDDALSEAELIQTLARGRGDVHVLVVGARALDLLGYMPGDLVVVDRAGVPSVGDVVEAEADGQPLLRLYEPPWLLAASTRSEFRRPELLAPGRLAVRGVVVAAARRAAAAAA